VKFRSESWPNGERIPQRHAAGVPDGTGHARPGLNQSPHLAWSDLPAGSRSLVLICHDFDAPTTAEDLNRDDRELSDELPRADFFHWVLVDLPARPMAIAEGEFGAGFVARGKPGPEAPHGARHGLNDYTRWFAGDAELAGRYFGYDGPFPPFNDALVHHYVFTLYALALPRLPLEGDFDGRDVRRAIAGHVLAEATYSGTYTLNQRLLAEA
jgi:Raf kinase inhibitor-like YbhB/YbcL family protein